MLGISAGLLDAVRVPRPDRARRGPPAGERARPPAGADRRPPGARAAPPAASARSWPTCSGPTNGRRGGKARPARWCRGHGRCCRRQVRPRPASPPGAGRSSCTSTTSSRSTSRSRSEETAAAERTLRAGDSSTAEELAAHSLERLRLPFFPTSDATWTRHWQDRVRSQRLRALHTGAEAAIGRRARRARGGARPKRRSAPTRSTRSRTRALMAAYEALGSRGQALTAYERCRRRARRRARRPTVGGDRGRVPRAARERAASNDPGEHHRRVSPARSESLPFVGRHVELAASRRRLAGGPRGRHPRGRHRRRARDRQDEARGRGGPRRAARRRARALGRVRRRRPPAVPAVRCAHRAAGDQARPAIVDKLGSLAEDLAPLVPGVFEPDRRGTAGARRPGAHPVVPRRAGRDRQP